MQRPVKPEGLDTPGLNWRERKNGGTFYWVARPDIVDRGYSLKSVRQWPPSGTKPIEPDADEWLVIASNCQRNQAEMLQWANIESDDFDARAMYDGTLTSLIRIYHADPDSPFHSIRFHTKRSYESRSRSLTSAVGAARIPETTFRIFKRWSEQFGKPAAEGLAKRTARAHALMTHLRIVIAFGALQKLPGCKDAKEILAGMEFTTPHKRKTYVNAEQCVLIRAAAHMYGLPSIALAQAFQYELMLRQKDAIGELLPMTEPGLSDVIYSNEKWMFGIDWREIDNNFILEHRLSKSLKGRDAVMDPDAGKVKRWDLRLSPMVMDELRLMAGIDEPDAELRRDMLPASGPAIVAEHNGRPWRTTFFGYKWRKLATAVGVPTNVQNRDSRAGGATEAEDAGADVEKIRKGLGHERPDTSRIYMRGDDRATAEVTVLRVKNRQKTP